MKAATLFVSMLIGFYFFTMSAFAADKVIVLPLFGKKATGNALPAHVLKGRTFSSDAGTGLTGTLILDPVRRSLTNFWGMTFYQLPPGTFTMGSPVNEKGRDSDEDAHEVTLTKEFFVMQTEVTQKQWRSLVQYAKAQGTPGASSLADNPSFQIECDDCPVEQVSFQDIQTFIFLLNFWPHPGVQNSTLKTYRLPTEAEWEYAVRAGSDTAFSNGDITETGNGYDPNLAAIGWYAYNSYAIHIVNTTVESNDWGLNDMHGNAWEWVQDRYGPYPSGPVVDPQGATSGLYRVIRGGGWNSGAADCRSANRSYLEPDDTSKNLGFRLAHQIAPAISIEKSTNGVDADIPPGPFIQVGQTVNWSYAVENTGNVSVTAITVTDDQGVVVDCPSTYLGADEMFTCTASGIAQPGQYVNIGTVSAFSAGITLESSDSSHYIGGD